MLAISIKQPYAAAILTAKKDEEYRSWRTKHRGPLLIHAGRTLMHEGFAEYPNFRPDRVVRGAVLGVVDVVDCQEEPYGGSFAWLLRNPRWLTRPFPCKGKLSLFQVELPPDLAAEVEQQALAIKW